MLEINLELVIFYLKNKITEVLKMLQINLHYKKTKNGLKRSSVLLHATTTALYFCSHHRSSEIGLYRSDQILGRSQKQHIVSCLRSFTLPGRRTFSSAHRTTESAKSHQYRCTV